MVAIFNLNNEVSKAVNLQIIRNELDHNFPTW